MKNFAELSVKLRPLSRSRAFRSKRHAAGTSPTQDGYLSKLFILLEPERVGKCRVLGKLDIWATNN